MGLQEWLARRMGVSAAAAAEAVADAVARRKALEAVAALPADQTQAIPESIRSAVQTAGAPTKGAGPAIPAAAGWDRASRVAGAAPAGGIKAAIERARAAREGRTPFRQLANEIRAAIEAATPVTVEAPPGVLQSNQFAALQDPSVQALLAHPDAPNALITIANDLSIPVGAGADLAGAVIRSVAENAQASARSAARADAKSRDPRMGSTNQAASGSPARAELGIDASGRRTGVYGGPEPLEPMEASPGVVVSYLPAINPVTGKPKQAYAIDPATGQPVLDPDGNFVPRIEPGTTNAPTLTPEVADQIVKNGLNYAGVEVAQEPIGVFAARTYKTPSGEIVQEPDFNRPVHQLVKRRTGGDGNRSPEAVEFLLPLPDGTFQRLTPGGGGRPEVLGQEDVQRLIYQGYEPQGAGLDWLRPQVESPQAIARRILEATMSGGTTTRRTAKAILDQYETLRRIGGQEAADAVLEIAGSAKPGLRIELEARRDAALRAGRGQEARALDVEIDGLPPDRIQALTQIAEAQPTAPERQTAPLMDAIRVNRDIAEPSTARSNAGLPELSRRVTSPQDAAFDFQAEGLTDPAALETARQGAQQFLAKNEPYQRSLEPLRQLLNEAGDGRRVVDSEGVARYRQDILQLAQDIAGQTLPPGAAREEYAAAVGRVLREASSPPPAALQRARDFVARVSAAQGGTALSGAPAAQDGAGVSVVAGLRGSGPAVASGTVDAAPPAGQVFDATGRESEILAGAVDSLAPPASSRTRAVWKNKDFDQPVEVTGIAGEFNGETYYNIAGSATAIPGSQLDFSSGGAAPFASVPYDTEARYDIFGDIGVRRPAAGSNALAAFVVSPDSWASSARPAAASLAEMLQQTRRIVGARSLEDLPRSFRRSFDNSSPSVGFVEDVSATPLRVQEARSAQDLRAALNELRSARGPGPGELRTRLNQLLAIDAQVQEQLAPLYKRLQELRSRQAKGDGFTTEPPGTSEEIARIQGQIDSAEASYRPALDEATRLVRERSEGPAAERFRQLDAQIIELERQYGLQASAEGDAADATALEAAGTKAAIEADPLSSPATLRPGRRKSASTELDNEAATRDEIDGARNAADPARNWTPASTLRQFFRDFLAEKLRSKAEELAELRARGGDGDVEAREKAAELSAAIERYRRQTAPLGLQDPESRAKEMREPSRAEIDSFERATAREEKLRNQLAVAPDEERNAILRELYKAQSETRAALRRVSPDFDALQESAAAAQDRHFQTLLGGGNDRAPSRRMDRSASDPSGLDAAYDGIGGFDVEGAVSGGLDGSGATRAVRAPQRAAMSADAALQELLRSDAGDARAVIEGIVEASNRAGLPMTPEQVIYSMLKNYRGASAVTASGRGADRMGQVAADVGDAGFSDEALLDAARRGWQDVQRMSPAAPQPSAVVGEYTTVQKALRGPARLREIIGNLLRPGDIARGAQQPEVAPQDQAWAMLPDPESISPDSAPGAAMPPELARQAQSQLTAAEQMIASLEQQGLDTTALRDRAQSVRNAIALRLQGELKPAPRQAPDLSERPGTELGEDVTPEDVEALRAQQAEVENLRQADGLTRSRVRRAAPDRADGPSFSQTAEGRRFLEDTLRQGGYSSAAGRAYAVDAEAANRLRALESENRGDIVASNRDEAARELVGDKDKQIDTSSPVIFGVNRKGSSLHEIVIARESGSNPVLETIAARPHDPNAPAPQGMEVVLFNDEGVPTFVRHESSGIRVIDRRGQDVDFGEPSPPVAPSPPAAPAPAAQARGAADAGGRPIPADEPVDLELQAARRARERQAARQEAEEIAAEGRARRERESQGAEKPAEPAKPSGERAEPEVRSEPDSTPSGRGDGGDGTPAGKKSVARRVVAGAVVAGAGLYGARKAQEAGYLPSNRDVVVGLLGPQMLAIPGYIGDGSPSGDTKQVPEPVVERVRRARRAPFLTSSNFLPK